MYNFTVESFSRLAASRAWQIVQDADVPVVDACADIDVATGAGSMLLLVWLGKHLLEAFAWCP